MLNLILLLLSHQVKNYRFLCVRMLEVIIWPHFSEVALGEQVNLKSIYLCLVGSYLSGKVLFIPFECVPR